MGWRGQQKNAALFCAGLLVGAVAAATFVSWHWNRNFERDYALDVRGQAFTAMMIRQGRGSELATQIETSLPAYVRALDARSAASQPAISSLWCVADFYDRTAAEPPADVQAVLARLPPKPPGSCSVDLGGPPSSK